VGTLSIQLAEGLLAGGDLLNENLLKVIDGDSATSLSQLGARYLLRAKSLHAAGGNLRGNRQLVRAVQILEQAGDKPTELSAQDALNNRPITDAGDPDLAATHLDSAVALLELSGHPHIMAREALAMLQEVGCAEAVALGARGPLGTRLVAAHGWGEAAARSALQAARDDELIAVGPHRDETWVLLARPRPELDHRCTLAAIRKLIGTARTLDQYRRDEKQRAALWPAEALEGDAESLWISEQSAELLSIARRIAASTLPVLLTGETGTGKEMLARVIHRASDRAAQPLHPFNCTAVARDMLDSQLFGYRKGAFTGADVSFPGVLRAAAGGTLFLDEIGEIGLDAQPKLLRFLEHSEIHPLGEPHPITVDVRIIAATNANLDAMVAQRQFREDLLYRLNVLKLHIPPLRERREEIPPLVQHYIRKYGDEQRKGRPTLSDETLEYLLLYAWPGNLRQLANEVRRMIALAEPDATLTPAFLSKEILNSRRTVPAADAAEDDDVLRLRLDQPLPAAVELVEQTLVRRALARSHGRVEDAARLLGISRKGLFLKRRRWGLRIGA
jgi:DNA-binding NtrC family response regulator